MLIVANSLQWLALALIIGGMLALGAFTAPVLFKQFARPEAGEAMTVIFRRYDIVITASLIMLLVGEALRWLTLGSPEWRSMFSAGRTIVLVTLLGLLVAGTQVIGPKLETLQKDAELHTDSAKMASFQSLHKQSEGIYKFAMLLAVLLLAAAAYESAQPSA